MIGSINHLMHSVGHMIGLGNHLISSVNYFICSIKWFTEPIKWFMECIKWFIEPIVEPIKWFIKPNSYQIWNKRPAIVRLALHPLASTHCSCSLVLLLSSMNILQIVRLCQHVLLCFFTIIMLEYDSPRPTQLQYDLLYDSAEPIGGMTNM